MHLLLLDSSTVAGPLLLLLRCFSSGFPGCNNPPQWVGPKQSTKQTTAHKAQSRPQSAPPRPHLAAACRRSTPAGSAAPSPPRRPAPTR
eukprot:111104-Chlamydomonas_euryale.AAC.2